MYELAKAHACPSDACLMIEDQSKRKVAMDWALRGENRSRLSNLWPSLQSLPPIADSGQHWDEDPYLLGCMNGVIDLRYGTVRKALPSERITMRVCVPYDRSVRSRCGSARSTRSSHH
jgi:phage/plasmid-associated DNA primase